MGKSFFFGPNSVITGDVISVEVNTTSGQVKLVNEVNQPLNIDATKSRARAGHETERYGTAWTTKKGGDPPGQVWD